MRGLASDASAPGKNVFAVVEGSGDHAYAVRFKPEAPERPSPVADERFYAPPYGGRAAQCYVLGIENCANPC